MTAVPGGKGQTTGWGTRVPWIANWPGVIEPGRVADDMVDLTGLLPTAAELGQAAPPPDAGLDGMSFAGVLTDSEPGKGEWVYTEHGGHQCVRGSRYRLYADGRFFDAETGPFERSPLGVGTLNPHAAAAHKTLSEALQGMPGQWQR